MLEPTPELKSEIGSLQWMNDEQLKKMYAELIPDGQNCAREDVLRSLIAYRLQEPEAFSVVAVLLKSIKTPRFR